MGDLNGEPERKREAACYGTESPQQLIARVRMKLCHVAILVLMWMHKVDVEGPDINFCTFDKSQQHCPTNSNYSSQHLGPSCGCPQIQPFETAQD